MNLSRIDHNIRPLTTHNLTVVRWYCAWLVGGLTLSGCIAYHAQPIDVSQTAKSYALRSLDDPLFLETLTTALPERDRQNVHDGIWQQSALLVAALQFNPALAEAREHIREASSGVQVMPVLAHRYLRLPGPTNLMPASSRDFLAQESGQ